MNAVLPLRKCGTQCTTLPQCGTVWRKCGRSLCLRASAMLPRWHGDRIRSVEYLLFSAALAGRQNPLDLSKNNLCKLDGTSGGCRCDPDNHNMLPGHSIDILSVASSVSVLKRGRTRPFDWPDENHVTRSILSCAIIPKVYSSHRRRLELFIDSQTLTSGLCAQWREYEEMQL